MKTKKDSKKEESSPWKEMTQTFVSNILTKVGDNISAKVQTWFNDIKRRTLGALLLLIGLIFVLVCVSLYINTFVAEEASWVGYGVVGILILGTGYLLSKK
ncbi:MAG: hypothetical protein UR66_C0003G0082 [Candidatus Moranbacteria bacterium GW2011_GWE1_35_17]|nr:MAG: hypothetical protein UR66_C0003G0082 [Candidatus Moranbacteria bacterium GW2011_GWE1_35_17]KKP81604.1 MAG: hypothetical protein UR82_C0056G0004 [Candidatus Moranbacteria bacterium GW2011_GWF1_35_5]KKP84364.1 MAG: hypothetical protein UR83_C0022G0001 [Candidatus Moranbacteria bacterium GW2011_GWF2_35_54]